MPVSRDRLERLARAISQLTRAFKVAREMQMSRAAHSHLSSTDVETLLFLGERGECAVGELAAYLGVVPTTATSIVDRLARKALVDRHRIESDRRIVLLTLTNKGAQLRETLRTQHFNECRRILRALSSHEGALFTEMLEKVAAVVSGRSDPR